MRKSPKLVERKKKQMVNLLNRQVLLGKGAILPKHNMIVPPTLHPDSSMILPISQRKMS
jgi:hypothetical protein